MRAAVADRYGPPEVVQLADVEAYDVVFDAVGTTTFGQCRRLLRPGGVFLTTDLGPKAQHPPLILATGAMPNA